VLETTALGTAWLAGQYAGFWDGTQGFSKSWQLDRQFSSSMDNQTRQKKLDGWQEAIKRTLPQI